MAKSPYTTVDEYISSYDEVVADKLRQIRQLIRETAHDAEEKLSWGAPTYYYRGYLLQFAAGKTTSASIPARKRSSIFVMR